MKNQIESELETRLAELKAIRRNAHQLAVDIYTLEERLTRLSNMLMDQG